MTLRCGTLPGSTPSHPPGGVHILRPARCHDNQPPKRVLSGITAGQGGGHRLPSRSTPVPKRHSVSGSVRVTERVRYRLDLRFRNSSLTDRAQVRDLSQVGLCW